MIWPQWVNRYKYPQEVKDRVKNLMIFGLGVYGAIVLYLVKIFFPKGIKLETLKLG